MVFCSPSKSLMAYQREVEEDPRAQNALDLQAVASSTCGVEGHLRARRACRPFAGLDGGIPRASAMPRPSSAVVANDGAAELLGQAGRRR